MSKPSLIVVTGPDGSGKSSLIAELIRQFNLKHGEGFATSTSVWDSMLTFKAFKKEDVEKYLDGLTGSARTLFIFHALSQSLNTAQSGKSRVILSDSYFYKYAACAGFPKPDFTFFLDVSPEEAASRKDKVTQYEGGEKFVDFQKKAAGHWTELEKIYGPWIHLNNRSSIEERVEIILRLVNL
jgi:thymidylate kinase